MADFRAKKALGQNFINDPQIIEAIVDACGAGPDDTVVEIGPGKGALTCTLAERAARVIAVELDSSVIPLLKGNLAGASNVEVVNEDILKFDWSRVVGNSFATEKQFNSPQADAKTEQDPEKPCNSGVLRIVGNLPYYITTPILLGILEKNVPAKSITVMVQKEVAERICAGPGGKDYGVLSISLQYYADCSYVLDVPAEYFTPRPKVDSAVVHMTLKKERLLATKEEPQFFALVKKVFSQRRKTLVNSLVGY
ncbi:MAG: ribosomal RNA small subunit methyltransferase A, partial [Firmicutes bacterium]|nr:ribosomal RNA small subunit methyltransferase A [Bacillota bacterium]